MDNTIPHNHHITLRSAEYHTKCQVSKYQISSIPTTKVPQGQSTKSTTKSRYQSSHSQACESTKPESTTATTKVPQGQSTKSTTKSRYQSAHSQAYESTKPERTIATTKVPQGQRTKSATKSKYHSSHSQAYESMPYQTRKYDYNNQSTTRSEYQKYHHVKVPQCPLSSIRKYQTYHRNNQSTTKYQTRKYDRNNQSTTTLSYPLKTTPSLSSFFPPSVHKVQVLPNAQTRKYQTRKYDHNNQSTTTLSYPLKTTLSPSTKSPSFAKRTDTHTHKRKWYKNKPQKIPPRGRCVPACRTDTKVPNPKVRPQQPKYYDSQLPSQNYPLPLLLPSLHKVQGLPKVQCVARTYRKVVPRRPTSAHVGPPTI